MLKYTNAKVVFAEVPNEISLAIEISGCPNHCPECHSKYLWEDVGKDLTLEVLLRLIQSNEGITCICFMGGDQDLDELEKLAFACGLSSKYLYRIAWYSGRTEIPKHSLIDKLDYIKIGPYKSECGPLTSSTTNQRFYARGRCLHKMDANPEMFYDITDKFWKNDN